MFKDLCLILNRYQTPIGITNTIDEAIQCFKQNACGEVFVTQIETGFHLQDNERTVWLKSVPHLDKITQLNNCAGALFLKQVNNQLERS